MTKNIENHCCKVVRCDCCTYETVNQSIFLRHCFHSTTAQEQTRCRTRVWKNDVDQPTTSRRFGWTKKRKGGRRVNKRYARRWKPAKANHFQSSSVTVTWWHRRQRHVACRHHLKPLPRVVLPSRRRGTLNLATTRGNSTRIQCKTTILSNQFLHSPFFTVTPLCVFSLTLKYVQFFRSSFWQIYQRKKSND